MLKRILPVLMVFILPTIGQAQLFLSDTTVMPDDTSATVGSCKLTDERITRLSEYLGYISASIEDCYYKPRSVSLRKKLYDSLDNNKMFCADEGDSSQVLNVVLKSEYNILKNLVLKVINRYASHISLSNYLELRLQILQMQTLLLQGKTYFLVSSSGQQTIRNITLNVSTLKEQLNEMCQKFGTFNNSVSQIHVELKDITQKLKFVYNYVSLLKQIYSRVESLEKTTKDYITQLQAFDFKKQLDSIEARQIRDSQVLLSVNNEVRELRKGQKTNRLLIILAPIITIAAIFIAK